MERAASARFRILEYCCLAVFAAVIGFTALRHEPWADEAQAWLLARDSGIAELWTRLLHYEGTPGLWHTLLSALIQVGLTYGGFNGVSVLAACGAAWVFIRFSPFPLVIRFVTPFTYYLLYQYGVIARSYSLVPILMFLCALFWTKASPLVLTGLLCLVAATGAHALALAVAVWLALAVEGRQSVASAALFAVVLIGFAVSAWPAPDVAFPFRAQLTPERAWGVSAVVLREAFTGETLSSIAAVAISLPFLWRGKGLILFSASGLLLCGVSVGVYWNAWSQGLLFLAWLLAMWVATIRVKLTPLAWAAFAILIPAQCCATFRSVSYDLNNAYSGSKLAAAYLNTYPPSTPMYAIGYPCTAIQPYFDRNVFYNLNGGKRIAYWDWSNRNHSSEVGALLGSRPALVMLGYKAQAEKVAWAKVLAANGYQEVTRFEGHLFWRTHVMEDESFTLYRRSDAIAAHPILSDISMADPASTAQLLSGFYGIESNQWRWTAREFVLRLKTPPKADLSGAVILLHLFIPAAHIERLGPITLAGVVGTHRIAPQTFTTAGEHTFLATIPPEACRTESLTVAFAFDKPVPPSSADPRELAAIVTDAAVTVR